MFMLFEFWVYMSLGYGSPVQTCMKMKTEVYPGWEPADIGGKWLSRQDVSFIARNHDSTEASQNSEGKLSPNPG